MPEVRMVRIGTAAATFVAPPLESSRRRGQMGPRGHLTQTWWVPLSAANRCTCTMAAARRSASIRVELGRRA